MPFIKKAPRVSFRKPIGSVSVSGHKFIGAPVPCGVVITRQKVSLRAPFSPGWARSTCGQSRSGPRLMTSLVATHCGCCLISAGRKRGTATLMRPPCAVCGSSVQRCGVPEQPGCDHHGLPERARAHLHVVYADAQGLRGHAQGRRALPAQRPSPEGAPHTATKLIKTGVWFSRPGTASHVTPNEGTAQLCLRHVHRTEASRGYSCASWPTMLGPGGLETFLRGCRLKP